MEIPRKIVTEIEKNGATVVVYPNRNGTEYGFMIYSLKGGQPHERIIRTRRPYCSNKKIVKKAGEFLVERIILTAGLENTIMNLN